RRHTRFSRDWSSDVCSSDLFLHSLRATIIASLAVPISLIGSFGVMYLLGYSLNNLSLMALTIATGFVVDDAIVMIENIARYIEKIGRASCRERVKIWSVWLV